MPRFAPIPFSNLSEEIRTKIREGMASGVYNNNSGEPPPSMRTLAWSDYAFRCEDALLKEMWKDGLLDGRLKELIRLRSAQINGCSNCASAIKDDSVSGEDVQCMVNLDMSGFSPPERAALQFVTKFATNHHAIEDEDFIALTPFFSVAEIVELGFFAAMNFGMHKVMSLMQVINDRRPLFEYRPELVNQPMGTARGTAS